MADRNNNLDNSGISGSSEPSIDSDNDVLENQEGLDETDGGMSGSNTEDESDLSDLSDRSRSGGSDRSRSQTSGDELGGSREGGFGGSEDNISNR